METMFEFSPKQGQIVNIDLCTRWRLYRSNSAYMESPTASYCTISVREPNGAIKNYHDGCVCNPDDNYNERTGAFLAFKKALRKRFDDKHGALTRMIDEKCWKQYHEKWAHFLSAMMDGKVVEDEYNPNQF